MKEKSVKNMDLLCQKITKKMFIKMTDLLPEHDDLERCNCKQSGQIGHWNCGICSICNKPRFICGHINKTIIQNKTMFNLQEYLEKTEKEFDEKWNLWHETTEQRNAIKSFLRSAIENAVTADDIFKRVHGIDALPPSNEAVQSTFNCEAKTKLPCEYCGNGKFVHFIPIKK